MNTNKIYLSVLLLLVGLVVYLPTINNNFYWEDELLVKNNPHLKFLRNIPIFFNPGYVNVYEAGFGERYRPLRSVTLALDTNIFGARPAGYHLTNLFFHLAVVGLVFVTMEKFLRDYRQAFFASLLFAVHPVHIESVAYIKNRTDILCAIFYLSAIVFFVKFMEKNKWPDIVLSVVLSALAFLSKEMALSLPLAISAVWFYLRKNESRASAIYLLPYYVLLGAYLIFKKFVMGGFYARYPFGFMEQAQLVLNTLGKYIQLLIFPLKLSLDRVMPLKGPIDFIGLVLLAAVMGLAIFSIRRKSFLGLLSILFLLSMLPVSNIIFLSGRPFAEQRLYLPSIWFCGIIAVGLKDIFKEKIYLFGMLAIALILTARSVVRLSDWKDEITLWQKTVQTSPESFRGYNNLAVALLNNARYAEALNSAQQSIKLNPDFPDAYNTAGSVYYRLGLYEKSIEYFKKSADLSGWRNYTAIMNLATIYSLTDKNKEALEIYQKALKIAPWSDTIYYNMALALEKLKRIDEAKASLKEALSLNPTNEMARKKLDILINEQ